MRFLFGGLRGRLTLTYTLVTVLALMALEGLVLLLILWFAAYTRIDERDYLNDVLYMLYPQASDYLQPGAEDLAGLQAWLEQVAASGYASIPPQNIFDSPAAVIVPGNPLLVLSPDGTVLAQAPAGPNSLVGRQYAPPPDPENQRILEQALSGRFDALALSTRTPERNYRLAVPVLQNDLASPVVGVILLTLEPAPAMILTTWPVYVGWVLGTGVILLLAVAPFGTLFGFIMSFNLTRRLKALARAADAWSVGNFEPLPADRSRDEIGMLGMRLRNMAERIQNLLHTQQELAALEERNRLARELHDTVKQQTFATLMQVRAARNLLASDPAAARSHLAEAEELIKTSQLELGRLIAELRPAALEGQGLPDALRAYLVTWSEHTRIPSALDVAGERRLPLALEQTLYRVAQEALANIARHSRASAAAARLDLSAREARLEITDNGVGFQPQEVNGGGFGLQSMRERLAALGGRLEVANAPDQGTRITAYVLLPANGAREEKQNGT